MNEEPMSSNDDNGNVDEKNVSYHLSQHRYRTGCLLR